jgi:hypothetical protein
VLQEYLLDVDEHVAGATSDAGPDIRRLCDKKLPGSWDWCICHLINAALADAFGTSADPQKSKNKECRGVVHTVKVLENLVRRACVGRALHALDYW